MVKNTRETSRETLVQKGERREIKVNSTGSTDERKVIIKGKNK